MPDEPNAQADHPDGPGIAKEPRDWKGAFPRRRRNLVFPNGAGLIESRATIHQRAFKPFLAENGIVDEDRRDPAQAR
ncbi:hypothetical protein HMH01_16870 [Halovulum dunhuangense]|uniref:Uncharacterized protein n=1 Tax=Halovulum dunhuangense TaxID=1505036 RepID=A0A849L7L7_9RHOB|nr:hypothetical protein [Halovulum dunhuangense]NNU82112.1 hypothetical protein [Halovulum dunhuangense]